MDNDKTILRISTVGVFLSTFALFFLTFARDLTFWDAGEFIATSYILGIPHPPGTPLFVILGRVWTLLPLPFTIAGKMNFFSVVCGASASAFYFLIAVKILRNWVTDDEGWRGNLIVYGGGIASALLSAFGFTVWNNNTEAEVYALSNLTIALLTWLAFYWRDHVGRGKENNLLLLMSFIAGLSVGNHLMALLVGPALLVFVMLYNFRSILNLRFLTIAILLFLLGVSIHIYLPIRAALNPAINEADPSNWQAFWDVLSRKQYGIAALIPRKADFFGHQIPLYIDYFALQFGNGALSFLLFLIGIYGAMEHFKRDRGSFNYMLMIFIATSLGLVIYLNLKLGHTQALDAFPNRDDHEVRERDYFFMISFAFYALWSGFGLASLANRLRLSLGEGHETGAKKIVFGVVSALLFLTSLVPLKLNYFENDRSKNFIASDYARDILGSVEPYGIIFTNGDNDTFPLWFLQEVEGYRRDVMVVNLSLLNTPWYIKQIKNWNVKERMGDKGLDVGVSDIGEGQKLTDLTDLKPIVSYTDEQIDGLQPIAQIGAQPIYLQPNRFDKEIVFKTGRLKASYPSGKILFVKDLMVLHMIQTNNWQRPIYFAVTVSPENKVDLEPYLLMQGLVLKIADQPLDEIADTDKDIYYVRVANIHVDLEKTEEYLWERYHYRSVFDDAVYKDPNAYQLLGNFTAAHSYLANAAQTRGDIETSIREMERGQAFQDDENRARFNEMLSLLHAQIGDYNKADSLFDSLPAQYPADRKISSYEGLILRAASGGHFDAVDSLLTSYNQRFPETTKSGAQLATQLSQFALQTGDTLKTFDYLLKSVEYDTTIGLQHVKRFLDVLKQNNTDAKIVKEWLGSHPGDSELSKILNNYSETGVLSKN